MVAINRCKFDKSTGIKDMQQMTSDTISVIFMKCGFEKWVLDDNLTKLEIT